MRLKRNSYKQNLAVLIKQKCCLLAWCLQWCTSSKSLYSVLGDFNSWLPVTVSSMIPLSSLSFWWTPSPPLPRSILDSAVIHICNLFTVSVWSITDFSPVTLYFIFLPRFWAYSCPRVLVWSCSSVLHILPADICAFPQSVLQSEYSNLSKSPSHKVFLGHFLQYFSFFFFFFFFPWHSWSCTLPFNSWHLSLSDIVHILSIYLVFYWSLHLGKDFSKDLYSLSIPHWLQKNLA